MKKNLVIKIGTKAIFDASAKKIKIKVLRKLAKEVHELLEKEWKIIIISSGAVGCGKSIIKKEEGGLGLKQAQAAVGQIKLMEEYAKAFSKYKINIAQFLLSSEDLRNHEKLENIKRTYNHLDKNIISIVNENDVTTTEELSFGDNDNLALEILIKLNFDTLLILTERGVLIKNKKPVLESNQFSHEDYDSVPESNYGFGGLKSKLEVAKKAVEQKKEFIIGKSGDSILKILERKIPATYFKKE